MTESHDNAITKIYRIGSCDRVIWLASHLVFRLSSTGNQWVDHDGIHVKKWQGILVQTCARGRWETENSIQARCFYIRKVACRSYLTDPAIHSIKSHRAGAVLTVVNEPTRKGKRSDHGRRRKMLNNRLMCREEV